MASAYAQGRGSRSITHWRTRNPRYASKALAQLLKREPLLGARPDEALEVADHLLHQRLVRVAALAPALDRDRAVDLHVVVTGPGAGHAGGQERRAGAARDRRRTSGDGDRASEQLDGHAGPVREVAEERHDRV